MKRIGLLAAAALLASCGGGGGGGQGGTMRLAGSAPLVLVAGTQQLDPEPQTGWADGVDLARLGLAPEDVTAYYDLTTPSGETFLFDAVSRARGNAGDVRVSVAHAADDGNTPAGGPETMAGAGIVPAAEGALARSPWLDAHGDGFSRVTLRGAVDRDQVFAVQTESGGKTTAALVRVRVGPESAINVAVDSGSDYPGVISTTTIYSSNSWAFGMPTAAVSGDRTTVVTYEGDRTDPSRYDRYEMRLQHDALTGAVTGGASEEAGPDSGNWRDHETAALYNTLALVHSGSDAVTLRLSFDRGATFGQVETLDASGGEGWYLPRLAQVSMAADYSLAVLFWRSGRAGTTDLVLEEGRPSAFDGGGSPTRFTLDPARTLKRVEGDVTPMLLGATWSSGGDLVVGYAFTSFTLHADLTWTSLTQDRCAVRLFGESGFTDTLVEEDVTVGKDPSVAVLGSGTAMRVFYAYEASDGVRLRVSDDAGKTFGPALAVGDTTSSVPTVLARDQAGAARVDLVYMAWVAEGSQLRVLHWDDYGTSGSADYRLTTPEMTASASAPPGDPVPGAEMGIIAPTVGNRVREVAWFGYDAVLDGDDVVVVFDEVTYDAWIMLGGGWFADGRVEMFGAAANSFNGGDFAPADPPPLAPGLTEPVPAPDPSHMHQLRLMRLD